MAKTDSVIRKERKKLRKLRKMGDITLDMELLLEEMTDTDQHSMQRGEVLALVDAWLVIHAPQAQEEYEDGTQPEHYYGPKRS